MALPFPTNDQFIPLTRNGVPLTDPAGDESPKSTDIVGDSTFPAAYFVTDDTYAFFRIRVNGDPRLSGGFDNFAWVVLFENDLNLANSYEWVFALDGVGERLVLRQNTVKNSPGSGFNDQAEGTPIPFPITSYDIARAVLADSNFSGDPDYFVDFGIEILTLKSTMGISDDTPLRFAFFTSANDNNFNKDRLCNTFTECFSDPVQLTTSLSGKIVDKDTGCPLINVDITLFLNDTVIAETTTDANGSYSFTGIEAGTYRLLATKHCYLSNCLCNLVEVQGNKDNILNVSLAPDCICKIKCLIAKIEKDIVVEKQRIYQIFTDFFLTSAPGPDTIDDFVRLFELLNDCTCKLDLGVAKTLSTLAECEEGDDNDDSCM